MDDAVKLSAIKISRQSQPLESDGLTVINTSETNAMSVLPRLLRTMTSRNSQAANDNQSGVENNQISNGELCFSVSIPGSAVNDSDSSSSSSSSFMSTPSSGSSLISFLSPGHLGPVAAMAAVALSTAVTTMSVNDIQESSGLVTLATASSLIEKEWRARASVVNSNNESVNNVKEHAETTLTVQHHTDLLTSTIQGNIDRNQQFALDGSPPLVIGALNTSPSQSLLNESTPVTRAVLNVQSLAAFIRETQKQCSISSPTTSIELPLTSVFPLQTETKLTSSCNVRQVSSPSYLLPSASTPSFLPMTPVPQNLPTVLEQPLHSESVAVNHNTHPSPPIQSTAFISLQPAPGSLISPSDLQQLVASGEFMSSAARQTLLGQSSDGSTRQLYLLVPSDCPVIMPRVSNNQPTMTPILPSTSPLIESIPTSAPILEAISPGVEPEENNVQMQSESSTCNNAQQVLTSVSHLATTMLNPMSSASTTALSTFLAGLEARNHRPIQQIQLGDPDMYTPNGHTYSSLVDETNRFRSYPTYTQQLSHHLPHNTTVRQSVLAASSTTSNNTFFQQESSDSLSLNQTCSVPNNITSNNTTTATITTNNSNNNGEDSLTNGHFQSPVSHSNVSATNTFTTSLTPNSDKTPQLPTSSKSNTSIDECRRNSVTNTILNTSNNRSEQVKGSTTYLEHLNPESKDIRRRVSHNEVERRRRDRINTWISELYKLLPPDEQTKSQYQSKGIVLKRVCEYFQNVDSMLKAANSAVEQIRVENSILRQRVHELQQENQLLSASLQLGAVAAAAHLKNRQPRPGSSLSSININTTNEGNIITTTNNNSGTIPGVGIVSTLTNNENCTILKDSIEFTDYQSPLTVFTVDTPNHHHHHNSNSNNHNVNFNQTNSNCITPTSSLNNNQSSCFTSLASINSIGGFNVNQTISPTNTSSSSTSEIIHQVLCPLTLPSLDHITMQHTDSNTTTTTAINATNTTITNNNRVS
uniref:BHLH domain-containing protein n=1 Tax=Schistosoma mansoni TaxID=6183 RepID=A0A5K4FCD3_SCHMA